MKPQRTKAKQVREATITMPFKRYQERLQAAFWQGMQVARAESKKPAEYAQKVARGGI